MTTNNNKKLIGHYKNHNGFEEWIYYDYINNIVHIKNSYNYNKEFKLNNKGE